MSSFCTSSEAFVRRSRRAVRNMSKAARTSPATAARTSVAQSGWSRRTRAPGIPCQPLPTPLRESNSAAFERRPSHPPAAAGSPTGCASMVRRHLVKESDGVGASWIGCRNGLCHRHRYCCGKKTCRWLRRGTTGTPHHGRPNPHRPAPGIGRPHLRFGDAPVRNCVGEIRPDQIWLAGGCACLRMLAPQRFAELLGGRSSS